MTIAINALGTNSCYLQVSANETIANVLTAVKAQIATMGWSIHDDTSNVFSAPVLGASQVKYVRLLTNLVNGSQYGTLVPYEAWNASTHTGLNPCYRSSDISSSFTVKNGFKLTHGSSYKIYIFASSRWLAMAATQDNVANGFEFSYGTSTYTYQGDVDHVYEISSFNLTKYLGNVSGCFELSFFMPQAYDQCPAFAWINTALALDIDTDLDVHTGATINANNFASFFGTYAEQRTNEIGYAPRLRSSSTDFTGVQASICLAGMNQDTYLYRNATDFKANAWNSKSMISDVFVKTSENMYIGKLHGLKLGQAGKYTWGQNINLTCDSNNFCKLNGSSLPHFAIPVTVTKNWSYAKYYRFLYYYYDAQDRLQSIWSTENYIGPESGSAQYSPTFLIPL